MPTMRIELDEATFEGLAHIALRARRPLPWHAEVLLTEAVQRAIKRHPHLVATRGDHDRAERRPEGVTR